MGWWDGVVSTFTGGISDVIGGSPWGSGEYDWIGGVIGGNLGDTVGSLVDPLGSTITETSRADSLSAGIDAIADPTHSVNYSLEGAGKLVSPSTRKQAPAIGGLVGSLWGAGGSAAGYGIGAHIAGMSSEDAQKGAAISAAASYAAKVGGEMVGSAAGTASDAAGADMGTGATLTDMGETAGKMATKTGINSANAALSPDPSSGGGGSVLSKGGGATNPEEVDTSKTASSPVSMAITQDTTNQLANYGTVAQNQPANLTRMGNGSNPVLTGARIKRKGVVGGTVLG